MARKLPYPSHSRGSGRDGRGKSVINLSPDFLNPGFQRKPDFPGEFVGIDFDVKFLQHEDVKGITLCHNFDFARALQIRLGVFNEGPHNMFPVNWPVSLNRSHMNRLKTDGPFVVAPKPVGIRYLLFVNSEGIIFMENNTQHVFKVDPDLAPKLPKDTILDGILVKKLVCGEGSNGNGDDGKLSYVIMDATRVDGVQLTQKSIQERISAVEKMMQGKPSEGKVFDLDIAKYVAVSQIENYLGQGFKDRYEYPLRSFVFHPIKGTYNALGYGKRILQWDESNEEEFSFRLKIAAGEGQSKGELYVIGPKREEVKYEAKIDLTDELRTMHGCVIECRLVDNRWSLVRKRTDRKHPNGLRAISGKLATMKTPVTREMLLASLGVQIEDN